MQTWGLSDPGSVREQNQDTFVIQELSEVSILAVVCDGMGGARSGDVASRLAMEKFSEEVLLRWQEDLSEERVYEILRSGVALANAAVYEKANSGEEYSGMGTTLVAAVVSQREAYIINVGDSRAYHVNNSGIAQVTTDHSFVQMMVHCGELTPEEAKNHPRKNLITRAIGTETKVEGDVYRVELEETDCLALCSDGLSNVLADQEILFEIVHGETRDDCCQRLLKIAKTRGAPDNVTVVVVSP